MPTPEQESPVWLITGCSTGFGRALAERVLQHGHRCVVTARTLSQIEPIVVPYPETGLAVELDVTDPAARDARCNPPKRGSAGSTSWSTTRAGVTTARSRKARKPSCARCRGQRVRARGDDAARAAGDARAQVRPHRQLLVDRRPHRQSGHGVLLRDQVRGGRHVAVARQRSETSRHSRHPRRAWAVPHGFPGAVDDDPEDDPAEYAETAGARRKQLRKSSGNQPGDPYRAADAIIKAVESKDPPLHLVLGKNALDRARDSLTKRLAIFDEWEAVTLSADYPK